MRTVLRWSSLITVVVLTSFIAWGWIGGKGDGWWGAVGQWFGAVGSLVAAGVALWVADLGRRDADRERRDDERNQARLVFSEYKRLPTNLRGEVTVTNRSTGMILNPVVLEISTDPAYGPGRWVVGRAHSPDREEFLISLPRAIRSGGEVRTEEVRPMERTTALPVYFHTADGPSTLEPEISPVATISFLDQHGREWIRRGADEPQRRIRDR